MSRALLVVLCACATASLSGQQGPTFRGGTNYVRVDMYATRDGQSIEDLTPAEVEVLEDGVPQKIEAFEYVKVAAAPSQDLLREPTSVRESREMAAESSRGRVFVIFLDTYHSRIEGSARMGRPLARFLDRLLGADDMVALMTPEMAASDIALGRKTTVISNIMQNEWTWGRRNRIAGRDPKELLYERCYPLPVESGVPVPERLTIAGRMKDRRREKLSLDALENLIVHLNGLREERKALLTITEGWPIFEPDPSLVESGPDDQRVGPGDILGRPPVRPPFDKDRAEVNRGPERVECEADRLALSLLDHRFRLRELTDMANRSNVTFYPVYSMGLTPFDSDIGPDYPPTLQEDRATLAARHESLRFIADMTDGTFVINTNNTDAALKRIAGDLSSYYLFGYYSSNTKLDGRFRSITVRVRRPGAKVRARRGYRGMTTEEMLRSGPTASPGDSAVNAAMSAMAGVNARAQFRIRSASWSRPDAGGTFWLVGELDFRTRKELAWTAGAMAELTVVGGDGTQVMTREVKVPGSVGGFAIQVPESGSLASGEYAVRVRVRPDGDREPALSDIARVIVGAPSAIGEAVLWRRGPSTGPQYLRTADPRFSRSDRIRLESASSASGQATARLLDRVGQPLQVPVTVTERPDPAGFIWLVADAALAPLAPGDYAIAVSHGDATQVTGFRMVP